MTIPKTPAAWLSFLEDLYAPMVEREDGTWERDPAYGIISLDELLRLLDDPRFAS